MVIDNTTMNAIKKLIIHTFLFLSLLAATAVQAANITVTTSRNPVALDDSFHLIYEADSSVDDDPDFSPIYKDFDVLNSSQSTNMRSVNGSWSMKKTWDLAVIAKTVGKFTIPPIAFGKDISPAIQVTVKNSSSPNSVSPDGQSTIPAKIFLESSIDKKTGWVQSQIVYTVRLLRTVSIAGASITDPVTSDPDAIIHKISEDNYQTTRNGIRYEVFERRYAIYPQKSGQLKINPVTFEGRVNAQQPMTIFDQFRMSGQMKRLRSKAISATIKAAPGTINLQDWLPASEVQLLEEWSDDIQNIKTGDPVTRTITIAAEGLTAVQLPDLKFEEIDGLKQYPDKPITEDRPSSTGITGLKQIKVAIIPTVADSYTLPEIKLQWWNTKTRRSEYATIPEKVLTASGSAATSNITNTAVPAQMQNIDDGQTTGEQQHAPVPTVAASDPMWKYIAMAFAIAWLITLLLLIRRPKADASASSINAQPVTPPLKPAIAAVKKHAADNDAVRTREALIEWARAAYEDEHINNLSQIRKRCSPQLGETIRRLNESLYSKEHHSWDGKDLLTSFKQQQASVKNHGKHHATTLKPLYNN
jgi:BatD DUF11 like domain